jgi:hypothetical protein
VKEGFRWAGRQIARFWSWATDLLKRFWTRLAEGFRWLGRQIARFWNWAVGLAKRAFARLLNALKGLKGIAVDFFNFMRRPFLATYMDQTPFKTLFLHICNLLVVAALAVGAYVVATSTTGWVAIAVMVATVPALVTCYLGLGGLILRSGNWWVGGSVAFGLAYFTGMYLHRGGEYNMLVGWAIALVAGALALVLGFPIVYATLRAVLSRLGLVEPLLGLFSGMYQGVDRLLSGIKEICAGLYQSILNLSESIANSFSELWNQLYEGISEWWTKMTGSK